MLLYTSLLNLADLEAGASLLPALLLCALLDDLENSQQSDSHAAGVREDVSHASQGASKVQHTIMLSRSKYVVREVCLCHHMSSIALMISESTISMSCWLLHAVLAAVTNGQNNLLESSNALCCECCSQAQGSVARLWCCTGCRKAPDGQQVLF